MIFVTAKWPEPRTYSPTTSSRLPAPLIGYSELSFRL
jgi:hypothetical protein